MLVVIGCCTLERVTVYMLHVQYVSIALHMLHGYFQLAENENSTYTSNLRWVYWDNGRMQMYVPDVQSINALFIAKRNTNYMLQALIETVKSATWRMTMPNATYSTTDALLIIFTILQLC